eukprot:EG_transcript_53611
MTHNSVAAACVNERRSEGTPEVVGGSASGLDHQIFWDVLLKKKSVNCNYFLFTEDNCDPHHCKIWGREPVIRVKVQVRLFRTTRKGVVLQLKPPLQDWFH